MTDRELLEQVLAEIQCMNKRLEEVEIDVVEMKAQLNRTDAKVELLETNINGLNIKIDRIEDKVDRIEAKVDRNYDKTVEFYKNQKEHNTDLLDSLDYLTGKQEMLETQTIKNTAELHRIK